MIEINSIKNTNNTSSHEQLGLDFEPIDNLVAERFALLSEVTDVEINNQQLDSLLSQETIRKAEEQRILDSIIEPSWNTKNVSSPSGYRRSLRDKVLIDVFGFPEGDSPKEVIKTGIWELKEATKAQAPIAAGALKTVIQGTAKGTWTRFNKMEPAMRRLSVVAVTSGALVVGLLAQEQFTSETNPDVPKASDPVIEMPKTISIAYSVPKSNPRVVDLAGALGVEPDVIIDQLESDGQELTPTSQLSGGSVLNLEIQGTSYLPPRPQTFEYIVNKFGLTGSTLLAANPELAGIGNDGMISAEVKIPKPIVIVKTPPSIKTDQIAQIPEIKDAIDQGQSLVDADNGEHGDIYVITDPTLPDQTTTSQTETTVDDSTTIAETTVPETTAPVETAPTTVPELEPIEVISPEVARVNAALDTIKIDGNAIDLSELTEAIKVMYASYMPNDKDRMPGTPEGYIKMMLAHEAVGLNVPFTVAERTADNERYTSPQTYAIFLAYAKVYQLRLANYPELAGTMARLRDANGPAHLEHNRATSLDISSSKDIGVKQYSDGPFGDFQFSSIFNKAFTEDVSSDMAKFVINGEPAIRRILTSGETMAPAVNNRVGRAIMQIHKYHKDHFHLVMNTDYTLTQWRPRAADLPWTVNQDLKIDIPNNGISIEQHNSQHLDFEEYISDKLRKIAEQKAAIAASMTTTTTSPLTTEAPKPTEIESIVNSLDATDAQKDFLKRVSNKVVEVSDQYQLNPNAVIAQAGFESGWGQSQLSKTANNLFGMKVGDTWKGPFVELLVGPEGGKYKAKFRKYDSIEASIEDYAKVIDSRPWYDDAQLHSKDTKLYLRGLLDELNPDGSVAKHQGEKGVLSYDFTKDYDEKVLGIIAQLQIDRIVNRIKGI